MHLSVSLVGTEGLKPPFFVLRRHSKALEGELGCSVWAMCGLAASSQVGDFFPMVVFRAGGVLLVLRSL